MDKIATITNADFGLELPEPSVWEERTAARSVIVDGDGKVAILYLSEKDIYKIPGGGQEPGEDIIACLKREAREEAGCLIDDIQELGLIEEFRSQIGLHQLSYGYLARLAGDKGKPDYTDEEIASGFEIKWLPLESALEEFRSKQGKGDYLHNFMVLRDYLFLQAAAKKLSK